MIRQSLENYFNRRWYESEAKHWLWKPVSRFYESQVSKKRQAFLDRQQNHTHSDLPPVLVVGNITVGGTGKTPLTIFLIEKLAARGLKVAVISRGYGGKSEAYPVKVSEATPPAVVGDEPYMLYMRTRADVVVDPVRTRALGYLASQGRYDLVISDDGLQHYALNRAYEIVVVDGARGLGNQACLPLGPLREPVERLKHVDAVVVNGVPSESLLAVLEAHGQQAHAMRLQPQGFISLADENRHLLPVNDIDTGGAINAIAAIGNPQRFFNTLQSMGVTSTNHPFPDHHGFQVTDLQKFQGSTLLMTEKDAVKVRAVIPKDMLPKAYYLAVSAALEDTLIDGILSRFKGEC